MNRSSRPFRTPANLSDSVHRQLDLYALAASAAGVGFLALAQPVEGKVVYTPANLKIVFRDHVSLDLNHDGVTDFILSNTSYSYIHGTASYLRVKPSKGNAVVVEFRGRKQIGAADLKAQVTIGPEKHFVNSNSEMMAGYGIAYATYTFRSFFGPWAHGGKGVKNRYLGLKFVIRGHVHYGWARLTVPMWVQRKRDIVGHLTGYAYETIANKAIITGNKIESNEIETGVEQPNPASLIAPNINPTTLGLLAGGSPGLSVWRRSASPKSQTK